MPGSLLLFPGRPGLLGSPPAAFGGGAARHLVHLLRREEPHRHGGFLGGERAAQGAAPERALESRAAAAAIRGIAVRVLAANSVLGGGEERGALSL